MPSGSKPVALIILDGWGLAPAQRGNAVTQAQTPTFDAIWRRFPHGQLVTSGPDVGLPAGQMGNSEVGHLNLGAGFVVPQELTRIDRAIAQGELAENHVLRAAFERARGAKLHLIGLLGDGGVHAHDRHLRALLLLAKELDLGKVWLHAITDGRDTAPDSAAGFVRQLQGMLAELGVGGIATLGGRYYAMDRDQRWSRTALAWQAMIEGEGPREREALAVLEKAHAGGTTDEFVPPTVLVDPEGQPHATIAPDDVIVLYNFRADRMRQLLRALTEPDFDGFERHTFPDGGYDVVTMTEYADDQRAPAAFPPQDVEWPLARVVSAAGLRQFHAAETEKYAHVTYFINGGREEPFAGEERCLVPSPKVATYDQQPEMSAPALTDAVIERIHGGHDAWIVVNYANPDMVGHTGDMEATVAAVEAVDHALGRLLDALRAAGGVALVLADHGNAEQMIDPESGEVHTAHTRNPVPVVLVDPRQEGGAALEDGRLADVAPTILALLGLEAPAAMTGRPLSAALRPLAATPR